MSELTFEQMLEESLKTIRNGEVVDGTVIDVKPDEIVLNIGYKADGILTKNEYSNDSSIDLTTVVKPGDTMEVKVLKVNDGEGQVLLTYKRLAAEKGNERLKEAFENHEVLKAPVTQILGGGLSVVVDEARVFIPASLVSDTYEKDLSKYQGQEIEFVISEFNPRRNRVIGDRRQLLVAERAEKQKELFAKISDDAEPVLELQKAELKSKVNGAAKKIRDAKDSISRYKHQKTELYMRYAMEEISEEEFTRKNDKLDKQIEKETLAIAQMETEQSEAAERLFELPPDGRQCLTDLIEGNKQLTREIAVTFIRGIKVYNDKRIEIEWNFADELVKYVEQVQKICS